MKNSWIKLPLIGLAGAAGWLLFSAAENGDPWQLPREEINLKPGPGVDLVKSNCLLCHSADYLTTQPPLTRAQWTASVLKMQQKFGAPTATNQMPGLVDYLVKNYGREK